MKILYVGDLESSGSCAMRMKALGELGHRVTGVSTEKYLNWGGKISGYLFRHYFFGPVLGINRDLLEAFGKEKPDLVWVDKGRLVLPQTLQKIKDSKAKLVHYTPDAAFNKYCESRHFNRSIPLYDLIVTTKSYDVEEYHRRGTRRLLFQPPAYDKYYHHPVKLTPEEKKTYGSDVTFVGHWERDRGNYLIKVMQAGIRLAVWGPHFQNCGNEEFMKTCWRGKAVFHDKYAKALSATKIGLGFLSKQYPDKTTSRTFEIPACGPLFVAERTEEQKALFREDKEAVYFGDAEELVSKLKYYLSHESARKKLAAQGHRHCIQGKNSYHDRLREIIREAQK